MLLRWLPEGGREADRADALQLSGLLACCFGEQEECHRYLLPHKFEGAKKRLVASLPQLGI
jgi:hypothetical protein